MVTITARMNFLREHTVQIDFDKATLSFIQAMEAKKSDWGMDLVMNRDSLGCPRITGRILGRFDVDFLIGTGANSTGSLEHNMFRRVLTEKHPRTSNVFTQTVSGIQQRRLIRIDDISVRSLEYQDLILGESNESHLGLSFLSRHTVTFDFPSSRVYFKKGKDFNKTDEADMSGLHLRRVSDKIIIHSVDDGSPARNAGIKANDEVLRIGDDDVDTYDIWDIRELLRSGNKRKIMMVIKSSSDVKKVSFLLEKRI